MSTTAEKVSRKVHKDESKAQKFVIYVTDGATYSQFVHGGFDRWARDEAHLVANLLSKLEAVIEEGWRVLVAPANQDFAG